MKKNRKKTMVKKVLTSVAGPGNVVCSLGGCMGGSTAGWELYRMDRDNDGNSRGNGYGGGDRNDSADRQQRVCRHGNDDAGETARLPAQKRQRRRKMARLSAQR